MRSAAAEILPHLLEASKIRGENYVQEMWRFILTPFLQALESEPEPDVICEEMGAFAQVIMFSFVFIIMLCAFSIKETRNL